MILLSAVTSLTHERDLSRTHFRIMIVNFSRYSKNIFKKILKLITKLSITLLLKGQSDHYDLIYTSTDL